MNRTHWLGLVFCIPIITLQNAAKYIIISLELTKIWFKLYNTVEISRCTKVFLQLHQFST
jgi:hypothetical protein